MSKRFKAIRTQKMIPGFFTIHDTVKKKNFGLGSKKTMTDLARRFNKK